jgi:TatD DNase family protein
MQFIDTHAHLYSEEFTDDIDQVIKCSFENNVIWMILPDIDIANREAMLMLHKKYPENCPVMIGLHPTSVKEDYKCELEKIDEIISKYSFCGIGETGIDLYWDKTFLMQQIDSFTYQVELALKHNLPLVIHSRKSTNEIFTILNKYKDKGLKGVFHCFPGSIQEAQKAIELGFYLGIGGVVTYKNSGMAEVVKKTDLKHIVLETDSPYLTPVPHRGKRNESSYIPIIAEFIASLKDLSIEEVAETTTENAKNLFHLSGLN